MPKQKHKHRTPKQHPLQHREIDVELVLVSVITILICTNGNSHLCKMNQI